MSERTLLKIISWFLPTFHLIYKKKIITFFFDADFIVLSMKIKNTIETSHAFLILLKRSVNNLKTRTYIQGKMMLALSTLCVFTPPPRKSFKMWVIKVQFSTLYYSKTTKHHQYLGGPPRHQPVYCSKKPKKVQL